MQRFDSKLPRLFQLAAGITPSYDIACFPAHRSSNSRAEPLQRFSSLLAAHRRKRAGKHEDLARQRPSLVDRLGHLADHVDAGGREPPGELTIARLVGKHANGLGHGRTDIRNLLQAVERGVENPLHRSKVTRERGRGFFSDVADAEGVDEARQIVRFAAIDLRHELLCRFSAHAIETGERLAGQAVHVGIIADEPAFDELLDQRFAEALDVHRRAGREMQQALPQLRGARLVHAPPDHFFVRAVECRSAHGTRRRHHPRYGTGRAQAQNRCDDLRNDIAAFLDDDGIAFADVAASDFLLIVQRRERDGRPGEAHRFEHGKRRHGAGAPDVHVDSYDPGMRLLCREFVGGRPTREFRRGAEPLAQREIVDLDHDPVGVEVERLAFVDPFLTEGDQISHTLASTPVWLDRQPPRAHRRQRFGMRGRFPGRGLTATRGRRIGRRGIARHNKLIGVRAEAAL